MNLSCAKNESAPRSSSVFADAARAALTILLTLAAVTPTSVAAQSPDTIPRTPEVIVDSASVKAAPAKAAPVKAAPKAAPATAAPVKTAPAKPAVPRGPTAEEIARVRSDSVLNALWPVKGPEPLPGALLPHKRIIAYYGNPLSKRMGVLGEYPSDTMLRMLDEEVAAWNRADPSTPAIPALHLIAVVAQGSAGSDGKYRARMADTLVERVAAWAATRNALVFLDVQVGLSTLQDELPRLEKFLQRPNFHLGIDPEFSMKNGGLPGKRIGTFDAVDINYATQFLAGIVRRNNIPPKVFTIHRFTQRGVTNYQNIKLDPAVQIVMHMDGFGKPWLKRNTFRQYIKKEPVQFVGWKQFYKLRNDNPRTTIAEILALHPTVHYIQYQ